MSTKTGLYLGKFAPLHRGHQHCIETALDECDEVVVLVYHTDVLDVPLQTRAKWVRNLYDDVDVIEAWTGPESHGYTEDIKREHEEYVFGLLTANGYNPRTIDAFYGSEPYIEHMASSLDAEPRAVDPPRETFPISGTELRNQISESGTRELGSWVEDDVYADLISRVAIVGGVSSGKTTLASALASHYNTEWMPEHGREFWETHADDDGRLTEDELVQLALEHTEREDEMVQFANTFLFVDTTPLTTLAWAKYYHGTEPERLKQLAVASNSIYDLHVLCDPHIPFEADPGREGRANRKRLHRMHRALMDEYNIDYITVGGSVEQRVAQVQAEINKRNLGLHHRIAKPQATNRWDN